MENVNDEQKLFTAKIKFIGYIGLSYFLWRVGQIVDIAFANWLIREFVSFMQINVFIRWALLAPAILVGSAVLLMNFWGAISGAHIEIEALKTSVKKQRTDYEEYVFENSDLSHTQDKHREAILQLQEMVKSIQEIMKSNPQLLAQKALKTTVEEIKAEF